MKETGRVPTPLDAGFTPAALFNRAYRRKVRESGRGVPLILAVEREQGLIARHETIVDSDADATALQYAERLAKFLLWARGGWRITVAGPRAVGAHIRQCYRAGGARAFDADLMQRVYGRPFEVVVTDAGGAPAARETAAAAGTHLDGCRIGFDLGASDYKVSAVRDGEALYTDEFPWNPKDQADPAYHYEKLCAGLRLAAAKLPRVDAIGGSTAGVVVDNEIRVASLFRSVPEARFADARRIFKRIEEEWRVPVRVANDGDVTALAGAMGLGVKGILGIAMGSSEAAGYLDRAGCLHSWLTELAFAPVDYNPAAPVDEWSGDAGVGALYFSQQAVGRLLPVAGIDCAAGLGLPERLKQAQALMAAGDPRAAKIYETIGAYLGYSLAHYAEFYDFAHVLILGRVMTGDGGTIIIDKARAALAQAFPELAAAVTLHVPDERSRRVGQAVAAASLPALRG